MNITEKFNSFYTSASANAAKVWIEIKKLPSSVINFFKFDFSKCLSDLKNNVVQIKTCSYQNCKKIMIIFRKEILCIQSDDELLSELSHEALNLLKQANNSKNKVTIIKKAIYSHLILCKPDKKKNNLVLELDLRSTKLNVGEIISYLNHKKIKNRELESKNPGMMTFLLDDIIDPSLERKITNFLKTKQIRNEKSYTIFFAFRLNDKKNPYFCMIEKVEPLSKPFYLQSAGSKKDVMRLKSQWLS